MGLLSPTPTQERTVSPSPCCSNCDTIPEMPPCFSIKPFTTVAISAPIAPPNRPSRSPMFSPYENALNRANDYTDHSELNKPGFTPSKARVRPLQSRPSKHLLCAGRKNPLPTAGCDAQLVSPELRQDEFAAVSQGIAQHPVGRGPQVYLLAGELGFEVRA